MNEETLFHVALQKPPAERAAFLEGACGGDAALRQRLEILLRAHDNPASFLQNSPVDSAQTTDELNAPPAVTVSLPDTSESLGTHIGPYKLIKKLGEGGMGTVYLAEQEHPVKRRVALKIIKAGMDSAQVIARFEAERQALAVMDHPNIAKVLDAGTVGQAGSLPYGRPYFVMELVQGIPITKYCDQEHLTPKERLELFIPVCQAVQHAHQKGIIHRDLKPSNVMVGLYDGKPIPKVIDFGVAKATQQKLTERTMFTEVGQIVGTLEYMAPEQAELTNLDIDTRADIYSLGVILYELLTGSPPFTSKQLRGAAFTEMLRMIREVEPSKPSTKLSSSDELPSIAAKRKLEPKKLTKQVHGELDWIVMKCLEKERARRYDSANGLALDVQRYLSDEPVLAGPPSARYRLRKFVTRNKRGLAVAACLLLAAGVTAISAFWQLRAHSARAVEIAERRTGTERVVEAALVEAQTHNAEGWKQIDDPDRWQGTVVLARSAVKRAEGLLATGVATAELERRLQLVRADVDEAARASTLRGALDRIRLEQATTVKEGSFDDRAAIPLYAAAFRAYGLEPDAVSAERLRSSPLRGVLVAALEDWQWLTPDTNEWKRLDKLLRAVEPATDAFRIQWRAARGKGQKLAALAQSADASKLPPAALVNMGRDLAQAGEWAAAERLLRAGQECSPHDFWLNHNLGTVLQHQRPPQLDEAVRFLTAALALRSRSPGVHINLGNALYHKKNFDEAITHFRQALELDPQYAMAEHNLGVALRGKGDLEGAIRHNRRALELDPKLALAHSSLGGILYDKKDLEGAIRHFHEALALDPKYVRARNNLGNALRAKKDVDGAIRHYRLALDLDPKNATTYHNLGLALRDKGDLEGAIHHYRRAIDLDPKDGKVHNSLGLALRDKGDLEGAIHHYRQAIDLDPKNAKAHKNLGTALTAKGDLEGAIRHYRQAIEADAKYVWPYRNLGDLLRLKKGDRAGAIALYRQAIELDRTHYQTYSMLAGALEPDWASASEVWRQAAAANPKSATIHERLGQALLNANKPDDAAASFRRAQELGSKHAGGNSQESAVIVALRKAVERNPNNSSAHFDLGKALHQNGDFEGAAAAYQRRIELDSKLAYAVMQNDPYTPVIYTLGKALLHEKVDSNTPRIACARKIVERYPQMWWAHDCLAQALLEKREYDPALVACRKTIELNPEYAIAHVRLGSILEAKSDLRGAEVAYRAACDLDPILMLAHVKLAHTLRKQGNAEQAKEVLRKAMTTIPKTALDYENLASFMQLSSFLDEAIALAKESLRLDPKRGRAGYVLGSALVKKGNVDEAIPVLRKAIEVSPTFVPCYLVLADALRQKGDLEGAAEVTRRLHALNPKNQQSPNSQKK